jgi:hypothetical protein
MRTLLLSLLLSILPAAFATDPPSPPPATPPLLVELLKSKREPEPVKEEATDVIDVNRARFFGVKNYVGPITYELAGKSLMLKEVEKTAMLGLIKQGEKLPTWDDVPAGSVVLYGLEPGPAELRAWGVVDGKPKKILTKTFTVPGAVNPDKPKPPIPVVPDPDKPPIVPVPAVSIDAELVKNLKVAIALDLKEYDRWKGKAAATLPEAIAGMARTYTEGQSILSLGDKNLLPANWGDLVERLNVMSAANKVPRLPCLENVRRVVGAYVGARDTEAAIDGTILDDLAKKFPTLSASLKESVK